MTLSVGNRNEYLGNDNTKQFSYTYKIFNSQQLKVLVRNISTNEESVLEIGKDYTVDAGSIGLDSGGSISLVVTAGRSQPYLDIAGNLSSGYKIVILREVPITQPFDFRSQGQFFAESHEDSFDRQTMVSQQLDDSVKRSPKLPPTVNPEDFDVTLPVLSAGQSIIVNPQANAFIAGPTVDEIANAASSARQAEAARDLAKDWASKEEADGTVDGTSFSSKTYALQSERSKISAENIVASSLWRRVRTVAYGNYTLTASDLGTLYICDASGGQITLRLPEISSLGNSQGNFGVQKTDNSQNVVTILRQGTDTIGTAHAASFILDKQHEVASFIKSEATNPANYHVVTVNDFPVQGNLVGDTDTQTLRNKSFSDALTLKQIAPPSTNPMTGYQKFYADTETGRLYRLTPSGKRVDIETEDDVVLRNYLPIEDVKFETTVHNYYTYNDSSGYVDGIGGNSNLTLAIVEGVGAGVLEGRHSLRITKPASNCQNQGVSVTTQKIDLGYRNDIMLFTCLGDFRNIARGDWEIRAYDVTNSKEINLGTSELREIDKARGLITIPIFVNIDTETIRISFHIKSNSTSAYSVLLDDVKLSPVTRFIQANYPDKSIIQYKPQIFGTTSNPDTSRLAVNRANIHRISPDIVLVNFHIKRASGETVTDTANTAGEYYLQVPPDFPIGEDFREDGALLGYGELTAPNNKAAHLKFLYHDATRIRISLDADNIRYFTKLETDFNLVLNATWDFHGKLFYRTSNALHSNLLVDSKQNLEPISMLIRRNTNQTIRPGGGRSQKILFDMKVKDNQNIYNTSNGRITFPKPMKVKINTNISVFSSTFPVNNTLVASFFYAKNKDVPQISDIAASDVSGVECLGALMGDYRRRTFNFTFVEEYDAGDFIIPYANITSNFLVISRYTFSNYISSINIEEIPRFNLYGAIVRPNRLVKKTIGNINLARSVQNYEISMYRIASLESGQWYKFKATCRMTFAGASDWRPRLVATNSTSMNTRIVGRKSTTESGGQYLFEVTGEFQAQDANFRVYIQGLQNTVVKAVAQGDGELTIEEINNKREVSSFA